MSRTYRRKKIKPFWLHDEWYFNHREQKPRYSDELLLKLKIDWNCDRDQITDTCPPAWFRQKEQKKHRRRETVNINENWMNDPIVRHDYKMPWYT